MWIRLWVVAYGSGLLRELFIAKSHFQRGFTKVVELELVAYESGRKESFDCMNAC